MSQRQLLKRNEGLEINELPENEMFVYDSENHVTHFLNSAMALVWERCDGKTDDAELEKIIESELNVTKCKSTVQIALEKLNKFNLLQ